MTLAPRPLAVAGFLLGVATAAAADQATVNYKDGLLSIRCADTPLAQVLEEIKAATGMAVIVEGPAGGTRLTAEVSAQPVTLAVPRLLEGTGVDYLLMADRADPGRTATLYVGDRNGTGSASAPGASPAEARAAARLLLPQPRAPQFEPASIPEALAEVEPLAVENGDDGDEEKSTEVEHVAPPITPAVPPAPGFHPVLDPFGRPIPVQTPEERATRARRRMGASGRQEAQD